MDGKCESKESVLLAHLGAATAAAAATAANDDDDYIIERANNFGIKCFTFLLSLKFVSNAKKKTLWVSEEDRKAFLVQRYSTIE